MQDLSSVARLPVFSGLGLAALGGLLWLASRSGLPLGRLPGDIHFHTGNISCFFPLATMILISLVLTVAVNLIARFFGK